MDRGHAEALVPMVEQVLSDARMGIADMERIAVTVGPAAYRAAWVGLSAARAFALACGRPAVGVTTLAALAAP